MKRILFDTDVLIDYLRGDDLVHTVIHQLVSQNARLGYTPITTAEVYRGIRSNEKERTDSLLVHLECLDVSLSVGRIAGDYLRRFAKSHGLQIADSLIAAAARVYHYSLCTFNWKHYPMNDIERYQIKR